MEFFPMMFRTFRSRSPYGAAATILGLTLTACGATTVDPPADAGPDATATPSAQVTATPAADAKVIEITLNGTTVEPFGQRVKVERGQPVVLRIDAAEEGELHVHSDPEQEIGFPAGTSEYTLSIDKPGVVDVEDHALDALIVALEVN